MNDTRRVMVARAALAEAGRPDLARLVETNEQGDPRMDVGHNPGMTRDLPLVAKAFALAHQVP